MYSEMMTVVGDERPETFSHGHATAHGSCLPFVIGESEGVKGDILSYVCMQGEYAGQQI